jgi:hypothetical protein
MANFLKKAQISIFMNIHRIGAGWIHADGMKDKGRLKVTFQNFSVVPKKDTPMQFICHGMVPYKLQQPNLDCLHTMCLSLLRVNYLVTSNISYFSTLKTHEICRQEQLTHSAYIQCVYVKNNATTYSQTEM